MLKDLGRNDILSPKRPLLSQYLNLTYRYVLIFEDDTSGYKKFEHLEVLRAAQEMYSGTMGRLE
jgi:hypothetical protein